MALNEAIVGTSGQLQVINPKLDGVAIVTADSTTATVVDEAGATVASGTLTYVADLADEQGNLTGIGGWYFNYTRPSVPQLIHGHLTIVKTSATMKWHETIKVVDFR